MSKRDAERAAKRELKRIKQADERLAVLATEQSKQLIHKGNRTTLRANQRAPRGTKRQRRLWTKIDDTTRRAWPGTTSGRYTPPAPDK